METKMIQVPFDIELARRISSGEVDGRIVTDDERSVRIVCWDRKCVEYPIVALIDNAEKGEGFGFFTTDGKTAYNSEILKLMLEIPEYLTYKDGDIIYGEVDNGGGDYCKWLSIVKGIDCVCGQPYVESYVEYNLDSAYNCGCLEYGKSANNFDIIRPATEEEKAKFVERLKASKSPTAKEYLEKYFGIKDSPKVSNSAKIGKKEELAQAYTDKEVRRYHKLSSVIEKYGMERARMTSKHESWELAEAYEAGWDACLKYLYTMTKEQAINKIKNYCKRKKELIMKYAEVRKAAEGYCDNEWKKEIDLQVRNCIDKLTIPAFIEGANWRVNASWHGAKEMPQERRFCLYILKDGSYGCGYYHKRDNTIWYEQFENVEKWAYFDDLIPFLED